MAEVCGLWCRSGSGGFGGVRVGASAFPGRKFQSHPAVPPVRLIEKGTVRTSVRKGTPESAAGAYGSLQITQQVFPFLTILQQEFSRENSCCIYFLEKIPVAIFFSRKFLWQLFSRENSCCTDFLEKIHVSFRQVHNRGFPDVSTPSISENQNF